MMNELTSKYGRFMTGLGSRVQELPQLSDGRSDCTEFAFGEFRHAEFRNLTMAVKKKT
jgi:hypothetical protein